MKKIYQVIMLCAMSFALAGCGNSLDYKAAVKDGNYEKAHEILGELHDLYLAQNDRDVFGIEEYDKVCNNYFSALDYVYGQEMREIIANDENCTDKIIFMLSEIPDDGSASPEGLIDYYEACLGTFTGHDGLPLYRHLCYCDAINKLCDKVLNSALTLNNENLARAIVDQYKNNVEVTKGSRDGVEVDSIKVDGNHGYVKYTTKSKDAALEKVIKKFGNE